MSVCDQNRTEVNRREYPVVAWPQKVKVIGLGNVLMGDDGFGPLVVELFRCRYACPQHVEIIDLGTPGLDMAPYFYGSDLIILVDCVQADKKPGSLHIYCERDITVCAPSLHVTGHDPGLQETLLQLTMAGHGPSEFLIVGAVPEHCDFGRPMSAAVQGAAELATETVACLMQDHGIDCSSRHPVAPLNLWWFDVFAACKPLSANLPSGHQPANSEVQQLQRG